MAAPEQATEQKTGVGYSGCPTGQLYDKFTLLGRNIAGLEAEIEALRSLRSGIASEAWDRLTDPDRLGEDVPTVAAIARNKGEGSLAQIEADKLALSSLNERIIAARGQSALWFSSETDRWQTPPLGNGEASYDTLHYMNVGILTHNASLRGLSNGSLSIPLTKAARVEIGAALHRTGMEELSQEELLADIRVLSPRPEMTDSAIDLDTWGGYRKIIVIAGDAAINEALLGASVSAQSNVRVMQTGLTATLF